MARAVLIAISRAINVLLFSHSSKQSQQWRIGNGARIFTTLPSLSRYGIQSRTIISVTVSLPQLGHDPSNLLIVPISIFVRRVAFRHHLDLSPVEQFQFSPVDCIIWMMDLLCSDAWRVPLRSFWFRHFPFLHRRSPLLFGRRCRLGVLDSRFEFRSRHCPRKLLAFAFVDRAASVSWYDCWCML